MIIRGVNAAVTREGGCTVLDMAELMHLLSRRERQRLIAMCERYNRDEQWAKLKPRPSRSAAVLGPRDKAP